MDIPYGRQFIDESDIQAVVSVLRSEYLTTGPAVTTFESDLSKVISAKVVSVSSGTAALHCAYRAIGLSQGDEIITPPLTFVATQATAALLGAKIVFADVQDDTGNLDPLKVAEKITSRTKAIVVVDFAGHPADMDELREIARAKDVFLIEDAAHSLGSRYKNQPVGMLADLTTFSFFPTKNIATAEGGAVASTENELIEKARNFSRQGLIRDPKFQLDKNVGAWHQEVHEFGLNYRLPDVLAALGSSQLSKLEIFKKRRAEIFNLYSSEFMELDVTCPTQRPYVDPVWHLYPIRVAPEKRRAIYEYLHERGIKVQVNYLPAHWHPAFKNETPRGSMPVAENYYESELSLPMSAALSDSDLEYVIGNFKKALRTC